MKNQTKFERALSKQRERGDPIIREGNPGAYEVNQAKADTLKASTLLITLLAVAIGVAILWFIGPLIWAVISGVILFIETILILGFTILNGSFAVFGKRRVVPTEDRQLTLLQYTARTSKVGRKGEVGTDEASLQEFSDTYHHTVLISMVIMNLLSFAFAVGLTLFGTHTFPLPLFGFLAVIGTLFLTLRAWGAYATWPETSMQSVKDEDEWLALAERASFACATLYGVTMLLAIFRVIL